MGMTPSKQANPLALKRVSTSVSPAASLEVFEHDWFGGMDVAPHHLDGTRYWIYITIGHCQSELFIRTRNHRVFTLYPPVKKAHELWTRIVECEEDAMTIHLLRQDRLRLDTPGESLQFQFDRINTIQEPVPHIIPTAKPRTKFTVRVHRKSADDHLRAMRLLGEITREGLATMTLTIEPNENDRSYITAPNGNIFHITRNPSDPEAKDAWKKFKHTSVDFEFQITYYTSVCIRTTVDKHTVDLFMCHRAEPALKPIQCNASIPGVASTQVYLFGEDSHDLPYVITPHDPMQAYAPEDGRLFRVNPTNPDHPILSQTQQAAWMEMFVRRTFAPFMFQWKDNRITLGHPDHGSMQQLTFTRIASLDAPIFPETSAVDLDFKPMALRAPDTLAFTCYGGLHTQSRGAYTITLHYNERSDPPCLTTANLCKWVLKREYAPLIGTRIWDDFIANPRRFHVQEIPMRADTPTLRLATSTTFIDFELEHAAQMCALLRAMDRMTEFMV